jgi:hypothetical protein
LRRYHSGGSRSGSEAPGATSANIFNLTVRPNANIRELKVTAAIAAELQRNARRPVLFMACSRTKLMAFFF